MKIETEVIFLSGPFESIKSSTFADILSASFETEFLQAKNIYTRLA